MCPDARPVQSPQPEAKKPLPLVDTDWPDPHPLPEALLPVAPFEPTLMPNKLQPSVADVTERMQCPPDLSR